MITEDVMDEVGDRLRTISIATKKLRVHDYDDDDEIQCPAGLISLPTNINYEGTFHNGLNEIDMIITILVSLVDAKVRRLEIAPYGDPTGTRSIKSKLDYPSTTGGSAYLSCDTFTVQRGAFTILTIAETSYKAFIATCKVVGSGSA